MTPAVKICQFLEMRNDPETSQPFRLMDWQKEFITAYTGDYRYYYEMLGKKNGKDWAAFRNLFVGNLQPRESLQGHLQRLNHDSAGPDFFRLCSGVHRE